MKEKTAIILRALRFPFFFLLMLWVIHIIKFVTTLPMAALGIYPGRISGLKGIVTAPLIHGDWQHLISNTVPLAALMALIFLFYRRVAVKSFILIYLFTGVAVWLLGRPVYHIGASGVVYGLLSFVFWTGVFRRSFKSIALSLVILVMYSGYFLGIVPGQEGISWESHLYGAIAGIAIAYLFKNIVEIDEQPTPQLEDSPADEYFLSRDTFEKTLRDREAERRFWRTDHTGPE